MGEMTVIYSILEGEPEGKRLLGKPTLKWEDNIKTDIHAIEWDRGLV